MRGVLVTLSSLALVCSSLMLPAGARASTPVAAAVGSMVGPASEPEAGAGAGAEDPRVLYEDGRKAYRLGDFEAAVEKWERAYALSDKPLLLYNISLAYKGRYTITRDISDLRRAKAILDNFIKLAQNDPDLDLDDAPERMAELEELIAKAEAEKDTGQQPVPPPQVDMDNQLRDMPEGSDPGKKFRTAGIATMGVGGGLVLIGAGVGIFFLVKSQDFNSELKNIDSEIRSESCVADDPMPSLECENLFIRRTTARDNGRQANVGGYASVGALGGLGLVALVAGAVLFTEGNRRSERWEKGITSRIQVVPTTQGVLVQGRF